MPSRGGEDSNTGICGHTSFLIPMVSVFVCARVCACARACGGAGRGRQGDGAEGLSAQEGSDPPAPLQSHPPGKGPVFGGDGALLDSECAAT